MASTSGKKTGSGTAKKTTRKKQTHSKGSGKQESFLLWEVIIWITLAVCILMLISNFGFGGKLGRAVARFLTGAFGVLSYTVPFLLFGAVSFTIANKNNTRAYIKVLGVALLFVLLDGFFEVMSKAGGSLGESVTGLFVPAIGIVGTFIVLIILMIISLVIITGKSAIGGMKKSGNHALMHAKAGNEKLREAAKKRIEDRKASRESEKASPGPFPRRVENRVKGGASVLTLKPKEVRSPEIQEVVINRHVPETKKEALLHSHEEPEELSPAEVTGLPEAIEEEPKKQTRRKKAKSDAETIKNQVEEVEKAAEGTLQKETKAYTFPPITLLKMGDDTFGDSDEYLRETAMKLQETLRSFKVDATVTNVSCGPSVTRYELAPDQGVKVSKIVGLADDIKLNLKAKDIRIEAPIPGKAAVGIEVPNKENSVVRLRNLLESAEFKKSRSNLSFAVGKDIGGKIIISDIARMPHLLVAGSTGSGKSVCINTIIMSIIYKASPEEVKLIMIDPKMVELSVYNGIPHLLIPVVTDPKKASGALNWAVAEMSRRYQLFATAKVRDMKGYNQKILSMQQEDGEEPQKPLPQIVVIVDELADLMMVAPGEVEEAICRLAQLARAAGIHLIIATQRPSVNVITGLIKANMPSRIAFAVSSGVDSRTILDANGAEKLLGKGDMLFSPQGYPKPVRIQGALIEDEEIQSVVDYLKNNYGDVTYSQEIDRQVNANVPLAATVSTQEVSSGNDRDAYFAEAGKFIIDKEKASIGMLQRVFKIGFNRAARIMDQLCEAGVVGPEEGTKPRKVLMSMEEFDEYLAS